MKADPDKRDKSKYCEFYKDHGHITKRCITLQNEIKLLIRRGKLSKFVDRQNGGKTNEKGRQRSKSPRPPRDYKKRDYEDNPEDYPDLPKN